MKVKIKKKLVVYLRELLISMLNNDMSRLEQLSDTQKINSILVGVDNVLDKKCLKCKMMEED